MKPEGSRSRYYFDGSRWIDLTYFAAVAEDWGIRDARPRIRPSILDHA